MNTVPPVVRLRRAAVAEQLCEDHNDERAQDERRVDRQAWITLLLHCYSESPLQLLEELT